MLATDHPLYEPLHYNMGAVWPFVTGFVALGHYAYGRPWSGYPLVDALARLTFDFARGRHAELLSGAFYRPLDTAVPHQFFASSMLATPILRGLVGWSADAPRGHARLAPQLPPSWERFEVRRLPAGKSRVTAVVTQTATSVTATLSSEGAPIDIEFVPPIPASAREVTTTVAGTTRTTGPVTVRVGPTPLTITTRWRGGYGIEPPLVALLAGQRSAGLRVLDVFEQAGGVRLEVEGPAGSLHVLGVHGSRPGSIGGADIVEWTGTRGRVRVRLPAGEGPVSRQIVTLRP
jgi:hypothetical protein